MQLRVTWHLACLTAVVLDCSIDRGSRFGQIVRDHDRINFNARLECKEPRFCNRRDLRSVMHFEKNERSAFPAGSREVDGLWLHICTDGLDGFAELAPVFSNCL